MRSREGCISVLVGARGVRGWILYLYGNVWGGEGYSFYAFVWPMYGAGWEIVVNRGGPHRASELGG